MFRAEAVCVCVFRVRSLGSRVEGLGRFIVLRVLGGYDVGASSYLEIHET